MESSILETPQVQFHKQLPHLLKQNESNKLCAMLERNPDLLQIIDSDGCTLLHHAVKHRNDYIATYLIEKGVDVNAQDQRGRTALMSAATELHSKYAGLMKVLLSNGAYVHSRDKDGKSVLQMMLEKHVPNVAALCARNLIALYSKDYDTLAKFYLECENPLRHLIYAENPMLTRTLLRQGAPVNATICRDTGETALHVALKRRDLEHVKVLVECGADVNAREGTGLVPLSLYNTSHRGSKEMLEILKIFLDRGALPTEDWTLEIMPVLVNGGHEEIQLLLQYNLNLRSTNSFGQTHLHILAQNGCDHILEVLQGRDFDVNVRDKLGRTPLHYAVTNRSSVDFLLKNGADVDALDEDNYTPLHHAFIVDIPNTDPGMYRACIFEAPIESIELLLESGANPQTIASNRITVVEEAVDNEQFIAVTRVLAHLAILAVRGVVIKNRIQKQIRHDSRLRGVFNFCIKKLAQMKTVEIWESVTLYDLLMEPEKKLAVYLRNAELVLKLARVNIKYKTHLNYYHRFIRRRVQKILQKAQVKGRAAVVIWKLMKFHFEVNPVISDAIVNYLDEKDLLNLLQV